MNKKNVEKTREKHGLDEITLNLRYALRLDSAQIVMKCIGIWQAHPIMYVSNYVCINVLYKSLKSPKSEYAGQDRVGLVIEPSASNPY